MADENDLGARVGKLEDDMSDLKLLIRGYWKGTERVPGVLDIMQTQQAQIATLLSEMKVRDDRHEKIVQAAWGLFKPVVAGVITVVLVQLAILIAKVGLPGVPHF